MALELLDYSGAVEILDSTGKLNNWEQAAYARAEPLTRKGVNVDFTAPFLDYNYSEIARVNFLPGDSVQGIDANNFYRYHYLTPNELQWAQIRYTRDAAGNWKPSSAVAYGVEQSADFGNFLKFAAPLFLFAIPGIGAALGNTAFSAAGIAVSPSVAAAVGNTAIAAALNGGDIESAIKSQLAGTLGNFAGQLSQTAVNSAALAKAVAAGTTAAAVGGNFERAILSSLASSGVSTVSNYVDGFFFGDDFAESSGSIQLDPSAFGPTGSSAVYDPNGFQAPEIYPASYFTDPQMPQVFEYDAYDFQGPDTGVVAEPVDYAAGYFDPVYGESNYGSGSPPVINGGLVTGSVTLPPQSPSQQAGSGSSNWFENAIAGITAVAMAAIKIVPALKGLDSGSVIRTGTTNQQGQTVYANNNGTVTLRNPGTGATQTTVPPPGVAYQTADGNLLTNNGNGTYTLVKPDGTRFTGTYTAGSVAGGSMGGGGSSFLSDPNNKPLIYGALALGAVLLLKGK